MTPDDPNLIADLIAAGVPGELVNRVAVAVVTASRASRDAAHSVTPRHDLPRVLSSTKGAIRARRYRDNLKKRNGLAEANDAADVGVTEHVTIDGTNVTRHASDAVESLNLGILSSKKERKNQTSRVDRGHRLPDDWQPAQAEQEFARELGLGWDRLRQVVDEFRDYWHAVPGQRGRKTNWPATFRNRLREITGKGGKGNGRAPANRQHPIEAAYERLAGRLEAGGGPFDRGVAPHGAGRLLEDGTGADRAVAARDAAEPGRVHGGAGRDTGGLPGRAGARVHRSPDRGGEGPGVSADRLLFD